MFPASPSYVKCFAFTLNLITVFSGHMTRTQNFVTSTGNCKTPEDVIFLMCNCNDCNADKSWVSLSQISDSWKCQYLGCSMDLIFPCQNLLLLCHYRSVQFLRHLRLLTIIMVVWMTTPSHALEIWEDFFFSHFLSEVLRFCDELFFSFSPFFVFPW